VRAVHALSRRATRQGLRSAPSLLRVTRLQLAMAESDLAKVVSLSAKAYELHSRSHYERCSEKWRAALAAAEALGAEDCLLVALFKNEVACSISDREAAHKNFPFSQAVGLELLDLHAASAAILRRRRAAGTLMAGKCRPIEVQWFFRFIQLTRSRRPCPSEACWLRHFPPCLLLLRGVALHDASWALVV
jgi:hypothetical protein